METRVNESRRWACRLGVVGWCGWTFGGLPALVTRAAEDRPAAGEGAKDAYRTAILAGGCFWCIEHEFRQKVPGVVKAVSGYSGGTSRNPTYKTYAAGKHREVVEITYDPTKITYSGLVEFLIKHVNPLDRGGSFIDRGAHYSAAIYYADDEEKAAAQEVIRAMDALKVFRGKITIAVLPRAPFWPAEDYHQDYSTKNPIAYGMYRSRCGRDEFVRKIWGDEADKLTLPNAFPTGANEVKKP